MTTVIVYRSVNLYGFVCVSLSLYGGHFQHRFAALRQDGLNKINLNTNIWYIVINETKVSPNIISPITTTTTRSLFYFPVIYYVLFNRSRVMNVLDIICNVKYLKSICHCIINVNKIRPLVSRKFTNALNSGPAIGVWPSTPPVIISQNG